MALGLQKDRLSSLDTMGIRHIRTLRGFFHAALSAKAVLHNQEMFVAWLKNEGLLFDQ